MGMLSAVVYTPPLTVQDAGALKRAFPDLNFRWTAVPAGRRAGATLGEWSLLWWSRGGTPHIPRLAPYAVPNPYQSYGVTIGASRPYPAGLYLVADEPPARDAIEWDRPIVGVLVSVAVTAAGATLSITHADGHVSTVPIPADFASNSAGVAPEESPYYAVIDYPSALASTSASGCSVATYVDLRAPRGVIVDPVVTNWLSGYAAHADAEADALPGVETGSDAGLCHGYALPILSYRKYGLPAWANGGRSLPREACVRQRVDYPGGWRQSDTHGYARPRLLVGGAVQEQACGPFCREAAFGDGDLYAAGEVFSSPARVVIRVDGTTNSGGASRTVTITEYNIDGSGGTVVYTGAFNDSGAINTYDIALPATLAPFRRYKVTRSPEQDYYTTQLPIIDVAIVASWNHPLPITVVASDGTIIPAGVAAAHLTSLAASPATTETAIGIGSTAAPSGRATAGWRVRASGLTPGVYTIAFPSVATASRHDDAGGIHPGGGIILAPAGAFSAAIAEVADGQTITVASVAIIRPSLPVGDTTTTFSPSYYFGQFTAPAAGRYSLRMKGDAAVAMSMFASKTDPLCSSSLVGRLANFRRRLYSPSARQDAPPSAATPLGRKVYLVGESPTGAWAGHAGELAAGLVGPASFAWDFRTGRPGDVVATTGGTWHCQEWTDGQFVLATADAGAVVVDLAAGEVVYLRLCYSGDVAAGSVYQSLAAPSIYGAAGAAAVTLSISSI